MREIMWMWMIDRLRLESLSSATHASHKLRRHRSLHNSVEQTDPAIYKNLSRFLYMAGYMAVVHTTRHVLKTTYWLVDTHKHTQADRHVENNTRFRYRD